MIPGMTICSAVQLRQSQSEEKWSGFTYFNASGDHFAKHQMEEESVNARTPAAKTPVETELVATLFRSPIFEQQKKLAGRSIPSDEILRSVLSALDQRGGRMTSAAISRTVNYPPMRLRGLLAVMQRVLNIDGFAVLTRDEASDTVDLNRQLLKRQFDLR